MVVMGRKIIKFYNFDGTFKFKLSLKEANERMRELNQLQLPSELESSPKKKKHKKTNLQQQKEPTKVDLFIELIS